MLGTLLEKLQSIFSRNFLLINFIPMLSFSVANGAMCYLVFENSRKWSQTFVGLGAGLQSLYGLFFLIGIAVLAYIFSTLNVTLREVLEGKYLPSSVAERLETEQRKMLSEVEAKYRDCRNVLRTLTRNSQIWEKDLREARTAGAKLATCDYSVESDAQKRIFQLTALRDHSQALKVDELKQATIALKTELERNSADLQYSESSWMLDTDQAKLLELFEYEISRLDSEHIRLYNERQFNFPEEALAVTTMGNIAASARSYAKSRYSMDLDLVWTRLQKVLQVDEKFYAVLQDAKAQLDFLISMFWLTVCFTVVWFIVLPFTTYSYISFLGVAVLGPLIARVWYKIAVQNYRAFADFLRASIDLYRLELLKVLHIRLPVGVEAECQIWKSLIQRHGYGQNLDIPYENKSGS
jgi:hypothetical protein